MTDIPFIETTITVQHVKVVLEYSFENARNAFESVLPRLDVEALGLLHDGQVDHAKELLERGAELSIFQSRDHGGVLRMTGLARKVLQYDVGNPLTAAKMTRHQLACALYAPFRVVLYQNAQGHAVFEYDKPTSLFGQFGDTEVIAVARGLDAAIERTIQQVGDSCSHQ